METGDQAHGYSSTLWLQQKNDGVDKVRERRNVKYEKNSKCTLDSPRFLRTYFLKQGRLQILLEMTL